MCLPMGCNMKHLTILSCKLAWTFQKERKKRGETSVDEENKEKQLKVMFKLVKKTPKTTTQQSKILGWITGKFKYGLDIVNFLKCD